MSKGEIVQRHVFLLHGKLFAASVFFILIVSRALALIVPQDYYFTFQSLFSDRSGQHIVISLLGKMLAPGLVGVTVGGWLYSRAMRSPARGPGTPGLARSVRRLWSPTLLASGFFAAFLSAWPNIAYWDLVSDPKFASLKAIFFVMYLLYMVAFGYVALLGLLAAIFWGERISGVAKEERLVGISELGRIGAVWIVNSGIVSSIMKYIAS